MLMCMPRKLANVEGGGQLPFRRLLEGPWKAYRGCLGGELASSGKLMCMLEKLANILTEVVSYPPSTT